MLLFLAILCAVVGLAGAIIPGLPGPPVAWLALLLMHLTPAAPFQPWFLVVMAVLAVIITVLDYLVPMWGTSRKGGTKAGSWGSTLGLIAGMFFLPPLGPLGLVTVLGGPFVGAWLGETLFGNRDGALRAAWGSFLGFLAGTGIKLLYALAVIAALIIR